MIQVIICPDCKIQMETTKLQTHRTECSSRQNTPNSKSNLMKQNLQEYKIELNISQIIQYVHIDKFSQLLFKQVKDVIDQHQFLDFKTFNLILNSDKQQVFLLGTKDIKEDQLYDLKKQIEKQINSYQVVSFRIDQGYQQSVSYLQDKYNIQRYKNQIFLMSKKYDQIKKVTKFCQDLLNLNKISKKISLQSQILQIQQDRQKQIQQIIKSIHMFIVNTDQISIKLKTIDKKCYVFISGQKQNVNICKSYILQSINYSNSDMVSQRYQINQQQQKIIKKQKLLQIYKLNYGIKCQIKNWAICRTAKINPRNKIYLISNPSLLAIPKSAVLILSQNYMKEMKQMQETVQFLKDYILFSPEEGGNVQKSVQQFINFYVETETQIGVILPEQNKQQFFAKIVQILDKNIKQVNLYVLERTQQSKAIQALQNCVLNQRKWYVIIKQKKVYYPDTVNKKIQQAIALQLPHIIVSQDQLKIKKITHTYNYQLGEITHIKTKITNFVQDQNDYFILYLQDGTHIVQKQDKYSTNITCAIYQINVTSKTQKNLLTDQTYNIEYQMVKKDPKDCILGQKVQLQLIIKYPDQATIQQIWKQIQNVINRYKIQKCFDVQDFNVERLNDIINWCKLNKIQIIPMRGKVLKVTSYNVNAVENLQKLIQMHKKRVLAGPLQYPTYWNTQQKQQLMLYDVQQSSNEFKQVEKKFVINKIKKLQRIQNKVLFDKYSLQKQFLTEQNGEFVRQVMMYHGTRTNPPELIYNDRQQSFNINYANMGSYGKGIYFAKKSQYSNNYCYIRKDQKQMFYCLVLAGKSQVYNGKQTHNTSYRDEAKRIRYESVVNGLNQDIMVVFKNRRAYPLYLITY